MSEEVLQRCAGTRRFSMAAWDVVESRLETAADGNRADSLSVEGLPGCGMSEFRAALVDEAVRVGVATVTVQLRPDASIADTLGAPVREILAAQYARRPGLPALVEALSTAVDFVETWKPVVWPSAGDLPGWLMESLATDARALSRSLFAAIETTRVPTMIHIIDPHESGSLGRSALMGFSERRGTSASFAVVTTVPGVDLGGPMERVSLDGIEPADLEGYLGVLRPETAHVVASTCGQSRWLVDQLAHWLATVGSQPIGKMESAELDVHLRSFWGWLCESTFVPLARQLDLTDRRILMKLADSEHPPIEIAQLIRAIGDTDRFNSNASLLRERIESLVERRFLGSADGRVYALHPGLSTYLNRI
jgi:hypothetical protein